MRRWIPRAEAVQATVFCTLGALMLFGALPLSRTLTALALVVLGMLVFTRTLLGPSWLGATLLALAAVVLVENPLGRFFDAVFRTGVPVFAGAFLIAWGVFWLTGSQDNVQAARPAEADHVRSLP